MRTEKETSYSAIRFPACLIKYRGHAHKLDPQKQAAFIEAYEDLLNRLEADEAVLFADAVHPTHAVRPVGCWAPKDHR